MNEDFLHRIRVRPPPEFLARLKSKLDRQPLHPPPRLARSVLAAVLAGASALALAALALRGELANLHWSGWSGGAGGSGTSVTSNSASSTPSEVLEQGWLRNPWAPQARQSSAAGSRHRPAGNGMPSVVAIPPANPVAPNASVAHYNSGAVVLAPNGAGRLRIAATLHDQSHMDRTVKELVAGGYRREPQIVVAPVDRVFEQLCADDSISLATATRRMSPSENQRCLRSAAGPMVEGKLGYQAIALVRSRLYGALSLSPRDIYLALAARIPSPANPSATIPNPYVSWNEVNPALPPDRILVLGPAVASEEGQTFLTLFIEAGCNTFPSIAALQDGTTHDELCRSLREDGVYVTAPPGHAALEERLQMLPTAVGVLPYPALQLTVNLEASSIDGVRPAQQSIEDGSYSGSRTLYLYVNKRRARGMDGLLTFLIYFFGTPETNGAFVPLSRAESTDVRSTVFSSLGYQPP